jgi:hypothetical protein
VPISAISKARRAPPGIPSDIKGWSAPYAADFSIAPNGLAIRCGVWMASVIRVALIAEAEISAAVHNRWEGRQSAPGHKSTRLMKSSILDVIPKRLP